MKKRVMFFITIIIFILMIVGFLVCSDDCSKVVVDQIHEYDAMMVCTKHSNKDDISSTSNYYIDYDVDENLTRVIYQEISDEADYSESLIESVKLNVKKHNSVEGIKSTVEVIDDKVVVEIHYDYTIINLNQVKKDLEDVFNNDNILMKSKKLPISLKKFKSTELSEYECKE